MKYRIEWGSSIWELEESVKILISRGWRPLGSPFVVGANICQSMTKEEPRYG